MPGPAVKYDPVHSGTRAMRTLLLVAMAIMIDIALSSVQAATTAGHVDQLAAGARKGQLDHLAVSVDNDFETAAVTRSLLAVPAARPVPTLVFATAGGSCVSGVCYGPAGASVQIKATFTEPVTPVSNVASSRFNGWLLITNNYRDTIVEYPSQYGQSFTFSLAIPADTLVTVCMTAGKVKNAAGISSDKSSNCLKLAKASVPAITNCPASQVVEATGPTTPVSYTSVPQGSSFTGVVTVSCAPPSGSYFPVGTTPVVCTATDVLLQSTSCTFSITITDTTAPEINCPTSVQEHAGEHHYANQGTDASWTVTATDLVDLSLTPACNSPGGSVLPTGGKFSKGSSPVTCTATDAHGNSVSCPFDVVIDDITAPVVTCPASFTAPASLFHRDQHGTTTSWAPATADDNVDGPVAASCDADGDTLFRIGDTTVTCTAFDEEENKGTCTFTVTVVDQTKPDMTCPDDIIESASDKHYLHGTRVHWASATAVDNVDGNIQATCEPDSDTLFEVTDTIVTCSATDEAGNEGICTFKVSVIDDQPPDVSCPLDFTAGDNEVATWTNDVEDNVDGKGINAITCKIDGEEVVPHVFPYSPDPYTIECSATDAHNNKGSCTFHLTVVDRTPPDVTCPDDVEGGDDADIDLPSATATDNVDEAPTVSCSVSGSHRFAAGNHPVTCSATDFSGNESPACSFTVHSKDKTKPLLSACPDDIEIVEGLEATWITPAATDNVDPSPVVSCSPSSPYSPAVGTHDVTCTATDASGNTDTCSFTVTVTAAPAVVPPSVTICPSNVVATAAPGQTSKVVTFLNELNDLNRAYAVAGAPSFSCTPLESGSSFPLGVTTVACTAVKAGTTFTPCTFTVTINAASSSGPAPAPVDTNTHCPNLLESSAFVGETKVVSFLDELNQLNAANGQPSFACTSPTTGHQFPIGTTTVTCTATLNGVALAPCSFNVKIWIQCNGGHLCPSNAGTCTSGRCSIIPALSAAMAEDPAAGTNSVPDVTAINSAGSNGTISIGLIVGVVAGAALLAASVLGVVLLRKRASARQQAAVTHQGPPEVPAMVVVGMGPGTPRSRRGTPKATMHPIARVQERERRFRPSNDGTDAIIMDIPQTED